MTFIVFAFSVTQQIVATDPLQKQNESSDRVRLQWKFAEGQTTYYTHEEEASKKLSVGGQVYSAVERSLFKYKWTVLFEMEPDISGIRVSFERVRHEIVAPDRAITVDTWSPLSPRGLSAAEMAHQDEVFRTLQTHFVFLATPSSGMAWPERFFTAQPVPSQFKTPAGTDLFSPDKFTTGDSLSLPVRSVKTGDEWTSEIQNTINGAGGRGHYRVLGRVNRLGHDCWQIEGTSTYEPTASQLSDNITNLKVGPRKSMHFFDAEIGRLVLSEETTPMHMTFRDGRTVETIVRVKRQLAEPPSESDLREVSRDLADGENRKFMVRGGVPVNAQNDWLKVAQSGLNLRGTQASDGTVEVSVLDWTIILDFSGQRIKSLQLFDVTKDAAEPLDYRNLDEDSESNLAWLLWGTTDISSSQPAWFYNDVTTERIVKVVVENEAGEIKTLYQLILVPTASMRSMEGITLPESSEKFKHDD